MSRLAPIGALRARLILEAPTDVTDDNGGFIRTFSTLATVWGEITPTRGRPSFDANQSEQVLSHRIRIRYRSDVSAQNRLRLGARIFTIRNVMDEGEDKRFLRLDCEEIRP